MTRTTTLALLMFVCIAGSQAMNENLRKGDKNPDEVTWEDITKPLEQVLDSDSNENEHPLTPEEQRLLDDPNTPEDVKDKLYDKLSAEINKILAEMNVDDMEELIKSSKDLESDILNAANNVHSRDHDTDL